jgi:hypothetical protein
MQSYFVNGAVDRERGFVFANPTAIIQYHDSGISFPEFNGS